MKQLKELITSNFCAQAKDAIEEELRRRGYIKAGDGRWYDREEAKYLNADGAVICDGWYVALQRETEKTKYEVVYSYEAAKEMISQLQQTHGNQYHYSIGRTANGYYEYLQRKTTQENSKEAKQKAAHPTMTLLEYDSLTKNAKAFE